MRDARFYTIRFDEGTTGMGIAVSAHDSAVEARADAVKRTARTGELHGGVEVDERTGACTPV